MGNALSPFVASDWREWSGASGSKRNPPLIARQLYRDKGRITVIVDDEGIYVCEASLCTKPLDDGYYLYTVGLTTDGNRDKDKRKAEEIVAQINGYIASGIEVPVIYGLLKLGFVAL